MSDRLLSFEAIENFRDFGGYASPHGVVRRGLLFRSGQLSRSTHSDLERLDKLGLGHVVDLRRSSERIKQPDRLPAGWTGQTLSTDLGGDGEAPHIQFLRTQELTEDSGRRYMGQTYERMPFDPAHVALFSDYFKALVRGDAAVLIHCAAGKDRTGLLAALTHGLLGVSADDIMEDYLATNRAVDLAGRAGEFAAALERWTGKPVAHGAVVAFLGVEADYLHRARQAIIDRCGSLESYMQAVLGISPAQRAAIIERLVD
ncbi:MULTISPECIES: tyrosine-protein phosphatase [unclassified Brevundimonas]|uniref:tyrosine-protein phosphatase n=1 Tax=unclassified Brevundimonas TaxID=2622653 RepID=UPI0025C72CC7|nr:MULTISPECIES: tyrosine-protein phosphatase [unclassified Brevundimonas]